MKQPLIDDQLNNIAGGNGVDKPVQIFFPGDNVKLIEHPECGIGKVLSVILIHEYPRPEWEVIAQFDKGRITASDLQFRLA